MIDRLSEVMSTALVGSKFRDLHWAIENFRKIHFTRKKSVVTAQNLQSMKTVLTLG